MTCCNGSRESYVRVYISAYAGMLLHAELIRILGTIPFVDIFIDRINI